MNQENLRVGGIFTIEHVRDGKVIDVWKEKNLVVDEGLNHMLNTELHGSAQVTTWYLGLIESGGAAPVAGDTAASHGFTESTSYDEATRPEWDEADDGSTAKSITNGTGTGATKATFTISATKTITGAFMISDNTKGGSSGVLFAASHFSASRSVVDNDQLIVTYTIQIASA